MFIPDPGSWFLPIPDLFSATPSLPRLWYSLPASCSATPSLPLALLLPPCLCSATPFLPLFCYSGGRWLWRGVTYIFLSYLKILCLCSANPSLPLICYSLPASCYGTPSLPLLCYSLPAFVLLLPPWIRDLGYENRDPGWAKFRIWDKHSGFATLDWKVKKTPDPGSAILKNVYLCSPFTVKPYTTIFLLRVLFRRLIQWAHKV
jgi:hypothetical protein